MISTSQKEHLTYSLILQCAILAGAWIIGWTYILPWIEKINASEESAKASITRYNTIKDVWLSFDDLGRKLANVKWKEELLKLIRSAPDDTRTVIAKTGKGEYIQWLNASILDSDEDKKKLAQAKQKINSILPTMSPISNSINEEYITLKEYIKFIEGKFLSAFNIKSNIVLGIQSVAYSTTKWISSVGTFDLWLDFRATNKNIQNLITYVNESGNPAILSFTGILTEDKIPKILSNPLMTIEALSLENMLDSKRPDAINNGRVTIRFYVRGSSTEDIIFLKEAIVSRQESLKKEIQVAIDECKKQDLLCTELTRLESFQKKYTEFVRSIDATKWVQSVDISILGQTASSLRALDDEFRKIAQK
jgi:hypothetical protein